MVFKFYDYPISWRVVDSHWVCVSNPEIKCTLAEYLWHYGFDIPESVSYCLANNRLFHLKYRVYGGQINTFVSPLIV